METEEKKYLVNIESNLDEYAQKAEEARKRVDELTAENVKLRAGSKELTPEIEKSNAALRVAQQEYRNAKKQVDQATLANKANKNSYEELYRQWQLAQTQLKLLGGAYTINEKGVRVLSQRYIEQSKVVASAKASLDAFGKGVHDNRLNVGSYSEAIEGAIGKFSALPGPIGRASMHLKSFIASFSKVGPIGLIIGSGLTAISAPLVAFFTKSKEGIDLLEQKIAGFKAAIRVLVGELVDAGDKMTDALDKPEKKTKSFWTWILTALGGPRGMVLGNQMDAASEAAENYTKKIDELKDAEIAMIVPRAKANLQIKEARLLFADTTKNIEVRIDALKEAFRLENKTADSEIRHQKEVVENLKIINEEKKRAHQLTRDDEKILAEAEARILELQTESAGRQIRGTKQLYSAIAELRKDDFTLRLLEARGNDEEIKKALKDQFDFELQNIELTNTQKEILKIQYEEAIAKIDREAWDRYNDYWDKRDKLDEERRNKDIKAGFEYQKLKAQNDVDALNKILDQEYGAMLASVEYQRMTDNEKLLLDQKYTDNKRNLSLMRIKQELSEYDLIADIAGSLSGLFEKQTVAAKALSVSQALISTYTAGVKAMAELPLGSGPVLRFLTLASIIAAGLLQVKNILAVKVPGGGGGASISAPTSITASAPVQRMLAQPVGATIFTQPTLTQPQLNALPNEPSLTAQDIADAISRIPAPIVTVEDINAKTQSMNKINVRANI